MIGHRDQGERERVRGKLPLRQAVAEVRAALGCFRVVGAYCHTYKRRLVLLALLSPVASVTFLVSPWLMERLIDQAYPSRDFLLFGWLCAALLGMSVLSRALSIISQYHAMYVQAFIEYKLSFRVFAAIHRLPQSYREQCGSGVFLVRAGSDVQSVAKSVTRLLPDIVTTAFTFLAAIPLMVKISPGITGIVLAVVPINYLITAHLTGRAVRLSLRACTVAEKIATFTQETIEGVTLCRIFSLDRMRRKQLANLLRERLDVMFGMWRTNTMWGQLAGLINTLWSTTLLCGGWYLVFTDRLQLGQAVALGMYISVLSRPFEQLALLYQSLLADSVAARRLLEILDAGQAPVQLPQQKVLKAPPRRYELHNLSFGYTEQRLCLQNVDLCLRAGQTIAVIGPTGGGKSTLLRILCGLEDRYQGRFIVDGCDLSGIERNSYLRYVSWVPQSTFFFSGPIRSNLPGNGSTAATHLRECAAVLGLDGAIDAIPEGFDAKLGGGGVKFSAGQYQKLAVLRAILKDAAVLLLDEPTASLDIESERKLLRGVLALRPPGCLTLLVTHHIPITVEPWIDEIVVLVNGSIAEKGSSTQLWERGGFYHHWLDLCRGTTRNNGVPPHQPQMT
ncbi:MAG: ABC transporter ATP-binding protein [Phycisphaerae bacterium]|nr:ABC transporter ATP-binding protein [Phycisphaerae bacterium]